MPKNFRRRFKPRVKKTLASKVAKLAKQVRLIKPELKFFNNKAASTLTVLAGAVKHLTAIPQGDDVQERVGLEVSPVSLHVWGLVSTDGEMQTAIRVIYVRYLEDAVPTTENFLLDNGTALNYDTTCISNFVYRKEYHVLYDKTFAFGRDNAAVPANSDGTIRSIRFRIPLTGHKIDYAGGGNVTRGSIYRIIVATGGGGVKNRYSISEQITYYDS